MVCTQLLSPPAGGCGPKDRSTDPSSLVTRSASREPRSPRCWSLSIRKGKGDFFEQVWHIVTHLGDTHAVTLLVGIASLAVIVGLRRSAPGIPGSLVAVALGIAVVKALD